MASSHAAPRDTIVTTSSACWPAAYAQATGDTPHLTLYRVRTHNLKDLTVSLRFGVLVGVAGVSGSGKSSLVVDTLVPLLDRRYAYLRQERGKEDEDEDADLGIPGPVAERLDGTEHLAGYAQVSQAPIGRQHTSTPASYIGIWGAIRRLYARQPVAVERGGHHIFCVPDRDLVVAIASQPAGRWRDRWPLLEEFIIPSIMP